MRPIRLGVVLLCCFILFMVALPGSIKQTAALEDSSCRALAENVLAAVKEACSSETANSVCYGFDSVEAKLTSNVAFNTKGSQIDLANLSTLTTATSVEAGKWGVAVLNIQADLPPDSRGIAGVLFGDATLTSDVRPDAATVQTLPVRTLDQDPVILRTGASPNNPQAVRFIASDQGLADGRSANSRWIRVRVGNNVGWASVPQVRVTGDISTLPVVDETDIAPHFLYSKPMQAFILSNGKQSQCAETTSGLLLQLAAQQPVNLLVNGVKLSFQGATLLLRSVAKDNLDVMVIAGTAAVRAHGAEIVLESGDSTRIRLGGASGLSPIAAPRPKAKYAFANIEGVPLAILPEAITCVVGVLTSDKTVAARSGPGVNDYTSLFYLKPGQIYPVRGWANDAAGKPWWKLASANNQENWVEQAIVRTVGACQDIAKAEPLAPGGGGDGSTYTGPPGGGGFAPAAKSIWNASITPDRMEGECSVGAVNFCPSLVALTPRGSGLLFKGGEVEPYYLARVRENVYGYVGRRKVGDGTIRITLAFSSPTNFTMSQVITLDAEPSCKHNYTITASLR